jgi:hypothetical protein
MPLVAARYRKEWRLYFYGREWVVVRWNELGPDEQPVPNPGWISDQLRHAAADSFTRDTLLDLFGDYWGSSESPHEEWHHLCDRLDEEFRRGSLILVQPGAAVVRKESGGAAPPPPPKAPEEAPPPAQRPKKKTWVAVRLVDEAGIPVAGEAYKITLPDNSVREGRTDSSGEAWIEEIDPGECKITFPDIDGREWSAA